MPKKYKHPTTSDQLHLFPYDSKLLLFL